MLAGRPNVGKSRLLNALAGYDRAIVDPTPGTTRDVVTVPAAFDGWPVELADTAGLRSSLDPIEAEGVALARARQRGADLVVVVLDRSEPLERARPRRLARPPRGPGRRQQGRPAGRLGRGGRRGPRRLGRAGRWRRAAGRGGRPADRPGRTPARLGRPLSSKTTSDDCWRSGRVTDRVAPSGAGGRWLVGSGSRVDRRAESRLGSRSFGERLCSRGVDHRHVAILWRSRPLLEDQFLDLIDPVLKPLGLCRGGWGGVPRAAARRAPLLSAAGPAALAADDRPGSGGGGGGPPAGGRGLDGFVEGLPGVLATAGDGRQRPVPAGPLDWAGGASA